MKLAKKVKIRFKDFKSHEIVEFPCYRENHIFDIRFSYPMKSILIEEDFDCESSDELIKTATEQQQESLLTALYELQK